MMSSPPDKSRSSLDTSSSLDESLDVVIRKNYKHLVENLRIFELLTGSHSFKGIISDQLDSEIMAKEPDHKQAMARKFINAFLNSKNPTKGTVLKAALEGPDLEAGHNSGGSDDADISRNSSNQDVEKGETKMLNIPPENNLSDDGPVSARTRSKLASYQHASEDSSLHGLVQLTVIVPVFAMETKLEFSSPHLINATVMKQNARALSQTDYKKDSLNNIAATTKPKLFIVNDDDAGHHLKQGYTRESSENRQISNDRICGSEDANFASEHRHSQDHQDVKDRFRSQSGQDVRHQANTVHGAQGNVSKRRDLHQSTNTRNCNSGELSKNSVSVESLASHSKSLSNRSETTNFHGDVTKDLSNKETTRTSQDRIQQPKPDQLRQRYVSCVYCEKRFLSEQFLNSHVETCDKKIAQAELKYRVSTKHSRSTGEKKRASVEQSLSSSAERTKATVVVSRSASQMPRSSTEMPRPSDGLPRSSTEMPGSSDGLPRSLTEMPRPSVDRPQPPMAVPRPLVFRCIKCDISFLKKKSLDKHERKGNCHL